MAAPIIFVDTSRVTGGALAEVAARMRELAAFVEANEPRPFAYRVYLETGEDHETRITVLQIHPDAASMTHHMAAAAELFRGFAGLLQLERMDVYGVPGEALLQSLREKVKMLGGTGVHVHEPLAGFARVATPSAPGD